MARSWPPRSGWLINSTAVVLLSMLALAVASLLSAAPPTARLVRVTPVPTSVESAGPAPEPTLTPLPFQTKRHLDVFAWAVYDRRTGQLSGEHEHDPSYTASVMKIWYAQDALDRGLRGYDLESMVRDSNDQVANAVFARLGAASTNRAIVQCGLTDVVVISWSWSRNSLSASDLVKLATCVGPQVQQWMATIRGGSDYGPRELLGPVMAKNGWMPWEGRWYANCVAMTGEWVLAIVQQYPAHAGEAYEQGWARGREGCRKATAALLA